MDLTFDDVETLCFKFDYIINEDIDQRKSVKIEPDDDEEMQEFEWDGPSDSDEEIECMLQHKN